MSDQWTAFIEARLSASRVCGEREHDLMIGALRKILALHTPDTSRLVTEPFCVCQDDDGVVHGEGPAKQCASSPPSGQSIRTTLEFREEAR